MQSIRIDSGLGVSFDTGSAGALTRVSLRVTDHSLALLIFALGLLLTGLALPWPPFALALFSAGSILLAMVAIARRVRSRWAFMNDQVIAALEGIAENDASPVFATLRDGRIAFQNRVARRRFGELASGGLVATLARHLASPEAVLYRLQSRAEATGSAFEDIAGLSGRMRLSVHYAGRETCLWRIEDVHAREDAGAAARLPMMTLSKSGTILFMNDTCRDLLGRRENTLERVFSDLPLVNGSVHTITTANGPRAFRIVEVAASAARSELYLVEPGAESGHGEWSVEDAFPVPMLKLKPNGEILMANQRARDLLGDDRIVGSMLGDRLDGLGRPISDWLAEAELGRGLKRSEVLKAKRQDRETYLQFTLGRIFEGSEARLVAVLHDATELKSLEAQFVQSQKMQAIGQLAGGVAHDFNNLLTAISGHCDLLLLRHEMGDPEYGDLIQISQNANRAASLVGQLLAFSRKQTLQPEVIDLRAVISDHVHLLGRLVGEKIRLDVDHAPDLPPIRADRRQFEQTMMNLVVNARDAMKETGGVIRIATELRRLKADFKRNRATVPAGDYVVIKVEDTGCGIPEDKLDKIFEPFFTTKKVGEGTGLGLSMAYGIVKQSGGFIFVDSIVGQGTQFTLYFPVHHQTTPIVVAAPEPRPALVERAMDGVILLVEDEAPVRAFAARALKMLGYQVIEAENAEEALRTLEDKDLKVDVFVTDVIMPGLDGPTWVSRALEDRPNVRVVFVSGYAEDSVTDHRARIPNSVFLPKPFSLSELTQTVRNQMH